jgi:hypothetical protein
MEERYFPPNLFSRQIYSPAKSILPLISPHFSIHNTKAKEERSVAKIEGE